MALQDCGTLESVDGREIYTHRYSVGDVDFDALEIGDEVWLAVEVAAQGSQASSVHVVGIHRLSEWH